MTEQQMNVYEGLFLFSQAAVSNMQGAVDHLKGILGRASAELLSLRKWDERRLAYEIKGNKRGLYFLLYFKAAPSALVGLERDCNLSEQILRHMIIRADHVPADTIEASDGQADLQTEINLRSDDRPSGGSDADREEESGSEADAAQPVAAGKE